jgi:hypothetical protein
VGRTKSLLFLDAITVTLPLLWDLNWLAYIFTGSKISPQIHHGAQHGEFLKIAQPSVRGNLGSLAQVLLHARIQVPVNAPLKVTHLLSHFYLHAKEIFCCSFVSKIAAFQMFATKVNNLRFILSTICNNLKSYLPNHLFLLTNYNQPSK